MQYGHKGNAPSSSDATVSAAGGCRVSFQRRELPHGRPRDLLAMRSTIDTRSGAEMITPRSKLTIVYYARPIVLSKPHAETLRRASACMIAQRVLPPRRVIITDLSNGTHHSAIDRRPSQGRMTAALRCRLLETTKARSAGEISDLAGTRGPNALSIAMSSSQWCPHTVRAAAYVIQMSS